MKNSVGDCRRRAGDANFADPVCTQRRVFVGKVIVTAGAIWFTNADFYLGRTI
jgi:hypothetical protein